jgi:hypothetical protein
LQSPFTIVTAVAVTIYDSVVSNQELNETYHRSYMAKFPVVRDVHHSGALMVCTGQSGLRGGTTEFHCTVQPPAAPSWSFDAICRDTTGHFCALKGDGSSASHDPDLQVSPGYATSSSASTAAAMTHSLKGSHTSSVSYHLPVPHPDSFCSPFVAGAAGGHMAVVPSSTQTIAAAKLASIAPHDYSGATPATIDNHIVRAYDGALSSNGRFDINGFMSKGNYAVRRTVEILEGQTKLHDKDVLANVRHVNFSFNLMDDASVEYLSKFLFWQELHLTTLRLEGNCITSIGNEFLFYNLRNAPDVRLHNIQTINLSHNAIDDKGAEYIGQSLLSGRYPNLRSLDLSDNPIATTGHQCILNAFKSPKVENFIVTFVKQTAATGKEAVKSGLKAFISHAKAQGVDTTQVATDKATIEYLKDIETTAYNLMWGYGKCASKLLQVVSLDFSPSSLTIDFLIEQSGKVFFKTADTFVCVAKATYDGFVSTEGVDLAGKTLELLGE